MSKLGLIANLMSHRFVKFLGVGGLNTLFGFAVYTLFALTELSTFMVLIVSTLAAITFNFFTTGGLVFRDLGLARVPRFLISYAVIFVINLKLIEWVSPLYGGRILAMAIIVLPMALISYFIQAWFVFRVRMNALDNGNCTIVWLGLVTFALSMLFVCQGLDFTNMVFWRTGYQRLTAEIQDLIKIFLTY
jgi:putative flippase GtrA